MVKKVNTTKIRHMDRQTNGLFFSVDEWRVECAWLVVSMCQTTELEEKQIERKTDTGGG